MATKECLHDLARQAGRQVGGEAGEAGKLLSI